MGSALNTGVSGLRAHQRQLDVVANNLANMNTVAFKSQMTTFSDLMYDTIRSGAGSGPTSGGVNPQQIGAGVQISEIARNFRQGALESTGELLDFAIEGDGFFVMEGVSGENVYSRAGSFSLDENGNLVDPATGNRVQRTGSVGEPSEDGDIGFQAQGTNDINIPLGAVIPGTTTEQVDFFGNLPSFARPPQAEVLSSSIPYATSTGPADLTTPLDDITINIDDYAAGDEIEFRGTNPDGTPFSGSLNAFGATMQNLIDALNAQLVGAVAELTPNGTLEITADEVGEAFSSVTFTDASGNVGSSEFARTSMVVSNEGTSGDSFDLATEVYDKRGNAQRVSFDFKKLSENGWELTASLGNDTGEVLDSKVTNILFNEDGSFSIAGEDSIGDGSGDSNIEIKFDSIEEQQVIELNFANMTHMATEFSLSSLQDGTAPGTLVSISVDGSGEIQGLSTNGKVFALAQLAIARFPNPTGLEGLGSNYFQESSNSGVASIGSGLSGGRGQIIGSQLEGSNVDLAQEFTRLIVAQRGFSANARTITVADEILEELTNIIR